MLVLTRKKGESIVIHNDIVLTVLSVEGDVVKMGITAPRDIDIYRKEIYDAIQLNNQVAVMDLAAIKSVMLDLDQKKGSN
ncbi:carbon storage regulator CsrA [Paenibacillus sp. S150]|uniref:carbon storage regulator CsrA n=1 Tax=Paenibacillus sp. S150 TaxID=2749826 RepID=UPI001C59C19A|nr:carbon storage regulator CsrA [Paenibacillus sp. S150]MBW4081668.1 carbon storage regulator CsrA [Paenibacillus sp. S150]